MSNSASLHIPHKQQVGQATYDIRHQISIPSPLEVSHVDLEEGRPVSRIVGSTEWLTIKDQNVASDLPRNIEAPKQTRQVGASEESLQSEAHLQQVRLNLPIKIEEKQSASAKMQDPDNNEYPARVNGPPTPSEMSEDSEKAKPNFDREIFNKELLIMRKWLGAWSFICLFLDFTGSEKSQSRMLILHTLATFILTGLVYTKWPELTKAGLLLLNARFFMTLLTYVDVVNGSDHNRFDFCDVSDTTNPEFLGVALVMARLNSILICWFINIVFCLRILKRDHSRAILLGLCLVGTVLGTLAVYFQAGLDNNVTLFLHFTLLNVLLIIVCVIAVKINVQHNEINTKYHIQQKQENQQQKRMIDSIDEAMLVVQKGLVKFQNSISSKLFEAAESEGGEFLDQKLFFVFKDHEEPSEEEEIPRKSSTERPSVTLGKSYSINEIVAAMPGKVCNQVFTFNPEFAKVSSMNHMQEVIDQIGKQPDSTAPRFNFFLIKTFQLERLDSEDDPEVVIQLIDISQKILYDNLSTERKYMAYMNSTISHEMRNPLNSVSSQLALLRAMFEDFDSLLDGLSSKLTAEEKNSLKDFEKACVQSMQICHSSCKLLTFNVEDILALPQLKDGRFTKNVQYISMHGAVSEVMNIQELQAKERGVSLIKKLHGFPPDGRAYADEKRFQQVLLNYQSNALKFINKKRGKILILLQLIPGSVDPGADQAEKRAKEFLKNEVSQFYGFNLMNMPGSKDDPYSMLHLSAKPKMLLSVLDNGVGIKEMDKTKLFKLFGCLTSTRSMNTQGIGLGLVITKMITEEFGGNTKMFSQFSKGSIFQSSFQINVQSPQIKVDSLHPPSLMDMDSRIDRFSYLDVIRNARHVQIEKCVQFFEQLSKNPEAFEFNKRKILIIDDESFNCKALLGMLKILKLPEIRLMVDIAYSGEEALQLLSENIRDEGEQLKYSPLNKTTDSEVSEGEQDSPQIRLQKREPAPRPGGKLVCDYGLIFTDCSMPFMDGYECCKRMLDMLRGAGIGESERPRILAVTGHVESEYQRKAIQSGMDQVYSKPIKAGVIAQVLLENRYKIKIPESVAEDLRSKRQDLRD